ncbi:hypothetical protein Goari_011694 [Gossypium aridum]|uniref:Glutaredoxin domain-containing protein n=1 Tax=Gossypium aridum TaxID=34290 RepID=A0A7J8WY61_GOSAI|nr:hypothetical protein [Gossypium aridum]
MNGKGKESTNQMTLPRVFIKGRYIGGADEVMRIMDECWFDALLKGLSKRRVGEVCSGCGHVRFLPCFRCNGSCKMAVAVKERRTVVVRCSECNESGLRHCPFVADKSWGLLLAYLIIINVEEFDFMRICFNLICCYLL